MATNPLGRLLARVADVEPDESPAVVAAFVLFFCVLGGYFAVRPVRETMGTIIGPDRVANLWTVTWICSILIVPLYGWLCARFKRSTFLPWVYGFVALSLAFCGIMLRTNEGNIGVGMFFYVFISVLNLFIVSVFWSFLLELFNPGQTRRLFGAIAAGGTAGALLGPFITDMTVETVGNAGILFLGAGMFVLAIGLQRALLRIGAKAAWAGADETVAMQRPIGGNPFAGFTLVLKSPYLLGIATFVILLASVNTFLYFEQMRLVSATFSDTVQRTRVFSRLDYTVQTLTIISQLFITGRVASKLGVVVLLVAVPLLMMAGFLALAATGTFAVLAAVMITRRVGEYAFVRPGREMLFSKLDTETKYKAKNVIDVPIYRGGDAVSSQVDKALDATTMSGSGVALIAAGLSVVWAINGYLVGKARQGDATPVKR